jgi:hypothetical protein
MEVRMTQKDLTPSQDSLTHIRRQLRATQVLSLICLLGFIFQGSVMTRPHTVQAAEENQFLRVRGITIEDAMGRPRILLGAPIAKAAGRKDEEDVYGMIVVGENGADRVIVSYPLPGPQRQGEAAGGVLLNDAHGAERGGYVADDDGGVALSLDGTHDEAIKLGVDPAKLMSWIALNDFDEIRPRVLMALRGKRPARLLVLNPTGPHEQEVRVLRLDDPNSLRFTLPRGVGRTAILDAVDRLDP